MKLRESLTPTQDLLVANVSDQESDRIAILIMQLNVRA